MQSYCVFHPAPETQTIHRDRVRPCTRASTVLVHHPQEGKAFSRRRFPLSRPLPNTLPTLILFKKKSQTPRGLLHNKQPYLPIPGRVHGPIQPACEFADSRQKKKGGAKQASF